MAGEVKTCIEAEDAPLIEVKNEIHEEEDSGLLCFPSAASSPRCRKICDELPDREEPHQIHGVQEEERLQFHHQPRQPLIVVERLP